VPLAPPPQRLTAAQTGALKPGPSVRDISDPGVAGLILRIHPSGWKSWLFRFKWKGSSPRISLGKFPDLSLADARKVALLNRDLLDRGIDPRRGERHARAGAADKKRTLVITIAYDGNDSVTLAARSVTAERSSRSVGGLLSTRSTCSRISLSSFNR
jgi:hypothetical protein